MTKALSPEVADDATQYYTATNALSRWWQTRVSVRRSRLTKNRLASCSDRRRRESYGLRDSLGDFDDAVAKAAELAKTRNSGILIAIRRTDCSDMVMDSMTDSVRAMPPEAIQAMPRRRSFPPPTR